MSKTGAAQIGNYGEKHGRKKIIIDRAILVGLNADCFTPEETSDEKTLDELEALLETAGGECAGKVLQNKHTPDPHSFIGEGKADEVRQMVQSSGANLVIFDNDLTPSQLRTLEDLMKAPVLDRSALILDILPSAPKRARASFRWSWRSISIICRA